jgi:hypothetical protein
MAWVLQICEANRWGMKTLLVICLLLISFSSSPQKTEPCNAWLTDFIQVEPKVSDGTPIDKYVIGKLLGDTSLKAMATCMVGLRIYVNCNGAFSYDKQDYRNNSLLAPQCSALLRKTEHIINGIKLLPGTIGGDKKDFAFKLVVRVKHDGKPVAEILY